MKIEIKEEKKRNISIYYIAIPIVLILGYIGINYLNQNETDQPKDTQETVQEDIEEEVVEKEVIKDPVEIFQVIEEQQAYIVVPGNIKESNPPTLIIYSHGSNTSVTEDMSDPFMLDMQSYGIFFAKQNYIFAASNQHGVNWGNSASIQDTLNLKNWVDENYNIKEKIFLLGFSMGGLPTLNFTTTYPELVSKVALLAPSLKSSEWNQERTNKVLNIDIKIWHGNTDVNVPYSYSTYFVNKLKGYGKEIPLVTLEGKAHFDIDTEYMQDILIYFNQ